MVSRRGPSVQPHCHRGRKGRAALSGPSYSLRCLLRTRSRRVPFFSASRAPHGLPCLRYDAENAGQLGVDLLSPGYQTFHARNSWRFDIHGSSPPFICADVHRSTDRFPRPRYQTRQRGRGHQGVDHGERLNGNRSGQAACRSTKLMTFAIRVGSEKTHSTKSDGTRRYV